LAAVIGAAFLLITRHKGSSKGHVATPTRRNLTPTPIPINTPHLQGSGKTPPWGAQFWHPGSQHTPPHGQPLVYGEPPGVYLQQGPLPSLNAYSHQASFGSGTPCGTRPSHLAVSSSGTGSTGRPQNFVTGDSLSNYGRAPADTLFVTYIGGEHRHAVTTRTGFTTLGSSDFSTVDESSSPAEILNAQLDFITEARGGMLSRFVKCAASLSLLLHA
jgi:hypothetical protein